MNDKSSVGSLFHDRLRAASRKMFWIGLAMVVLGIAALVFPFVSTMTVALLVGWVLLISGVINLVNAFSIQGTGPFFGALLFGLLSIAAGIFLLSHPLGGAAALTITVGVIFMFQGAYEIVLAFEARPLKGWGGVLFSGIASIVLAVLIMAGWPRISAVMLGILFGINFVSMGIGYISVAHALKPKA